MTLQFGTYEMFDRIVVSEDLSKGELVRGFDILASFNNGTTSSLFHGSSIGHKFILVSCGRGKGGGGKGSL